MKGLEPPRLSAPDPKSGVATNYTTSAVKNELLFLLWVQIYKLIFNTQYYFVFFYFKKSFLFLPFQFFVILNIYYGITRDG